MPWTINTARILSKTTTAREVALARDADGVLLAQPAQGTIEIPFADYTKRVRLVLNCSADGRSCWEVGFMNDAGATVTNLTVRRVVLGTPQNPPALEVAHGLASGVAGVLRVTLGEGRFRVDLEQPGVSFAQQVYNNINAPTYAGQTAYGVASDADGASAGPLRVTPTLATPESTTNVVTIIAAGSVYSVSNDSSRLLAGGVLPSGGPVSYASFGGKGYAMGGGRLLEIDYINNTVSGLLPLIGTLPGGSSVAGQTNGTFVFAFGERLGVISGNLVSFCAIAQANNWNTGDNGSQGGAYTIALPEPALAACEFSLNALLISTRNSLYVLAGEPALGSLEQLPNTQDAGASGIRSLLPVTGQGAYVHTWDGLQRVVGLQQIERLSDPVLRRFITQAASQRDNYDVTIAREPRYSLVYVFLTPKDGSQGTHVIYDEMSGAFFIDRYPASIGPTCAALVNGEVWIGGRDGAVYKFADNFPRTDNGAAVDHQLPVQFVDDGQVFSDVSLTTLRVSLARDSQPVTVKVFGGTSPEAVFDPGARVERYRFTQAAANYTARSVGVSDESLLVTLQAKDAGGWFALEQLDAQIERLPPDSIPRNRTPSVTTAGAGVEYRPPPPTPPAEGPASSVLAPGRGGDLPVD